MTDGIRFYAIYTYKCGELNWAHDRDRYAFIGFIVYPIFHVEHLLSGKPNVTDIACINNDTSVWSNVVYPFYYINVTFDPLQFVSEIESVPYQVRLELVILTCIIMHAWSAAFRSTYH